MYVGGNLHCSAWRKISFRRALDFEKSGTDCERFFVLYLTMFAFQHGVYRIEAADPMTCPGIFEPYRRKKAHAWQAAVGNGRFAFKRAALLADVRDRTDCRALSGGNSLAHR